MQYTHKHNNGFRPAAAAAPGGVPKGYPASNMQVYFYDRDSVNVSDMYPNGAATPIHFGGKQQLSSHSNGHGHVILRNVDADDPLLQSPSPPLSSISSDFQSQSSVEYHGDSGSPPSDNLSSSQSKFAAQIGHVPHGMADYVTSPDSVQGFSAAVQPASLTAESFDGNGNSKSLKHMLKEIENALLDSDEEDEESPGEASISQWTTNSTINMQNLALSDTHHGNLNVVAQPYFTGMSPMNQEDRVRSLLLMCAKAIAEERLDIVERLMGDLRQEVSVFGSPIERLAAYMAEGLVARLQSTGFSIYHFLNCNEAPAPQVLSAMQKLYEICPYIKFAYMATYGAIAEAFKDEAKVHIFDFQIAQGTQWIPLIQSLASRPGGPPSVRITTVHDEDAQGLPIGGMQLVKEKLSNFAASLNVPFEFNCVMCSVCELKADMIERREGEALAVNFTLQLHHLPDESVSVTNPRDRIIREIKSMHPKVFTLVEQEANTNTTPFFARFKEALEFYTAMFDSIDVALPRDSKDRVNVEEQCLARDIVNLIACEGPERMERHELMGKWRSRMAMAGFKPCPLSSHVNNTIGALLEKYNSNYILKEEGGALFLGWMNRFLVVASAWH